MITGGFEVKTTLSDEDMRDIVCAGFEAGSYGSFEIVGYSYDGTNARPAWADNMFRSGKPWPRYCWVWAVGAIHVKDQYGDGQTGEITRESLNRGLQILAEKYPRTYARLTTDGGDAIDSDALLQAAAFGDVIYG